MAGDETGAIWTRTGRSFLADDALTEGLLSRLWSAIDAAGLREELNTDWRLFDTEMMSWFAKPGP